MMRWLMLIVLVGVTGWIWFHPTPRPLEQTATRALTAYLGRGQFELALNLEMDRSEMSRTVRDVAGPESTVVVNSQSVTEKFHEDSEDSYFTEKSASKVETDVIEEKTVRREPELKGIHAVVVLYRPADKAVVARVVGAALGLQPERGDEVLVVDSQSGHRPRLLSLACLLVGGLLGLAVGRRLWHRPRRDWV